MHIHIVTFMNTYKVSVIVPNYNHAPYLQARIDSILNQTFQNFELILLDDASTDKSASILYRYQNNQHVTRIEINETNSGSPFQQWIKGISLAQGEYIWIAESDDLCVSSFLSTTVGLLDRHPEVAVCFTGSTLIDENGNTLPSDINKWGKLEKKCKKKYALFTGKAYATHNLYWRNYIANASSALFRKSCFKQTIAEQCVQMRYSGDWLFWFKLSLQGDVIEVYDKQNLFRQHEQKVTVKANYNGEGKKEDIEIIHQMELALPNLGSYKRIIRHGLLYNHIRKLPIPHQTKEKLYALLKQKLNATATDGCLARFNHILRFIYPFAINMKNDRLHPS